LRPGASSSNSRLISRRGTSPTSARSRTKHYWDGLSINRSQDNFVVQWGDPAEEDAQRKPLGSAKTTSARGVHPCKRRTALRPSARRRWLGAAGRLQQWFPAARDPKGGQAWLAHCYGTVGAGRDTAADSSNGTELYVVDGQSPRQLDRNITVVGRVVQGMELLSVLPRGTGPLGFYEQAGQRVPMKAIALAADVPESQRTPLQALRTGHAAVHRRRRVAAQPSRRLVQGAGRPYRPVQRAAARTRAAEIASANPPMPAHRRDAVETQAAQRPPLLLLRLPREGARVARRAFADLTCS
jgi:cyclophilin family peptidyl-prolyl cis-trans isomerase